MSLSSRIPNSEQGSSGLAKAVAKLTADPWVMVRRRRWHAGRALSLIGLAGALLGVLLLGVKRRDAPVPANDTIILGADVDPQLADRSGEDVIYGSGCWDRLYGENELPRQDLWLAELVLVTAE